MRQTTAFFAVFASLSLLPACQTIEDRAKASVESKAEKQLNLSLLGGRVKTGVCPDFPKEVPLYPGATDTKCMSWDSAKTRSSPIYRALDSDGSGHDDENVNLHLLTFDASEPWPNVRGFYEKRMSGFEKSSDVPPELSVYPLDDVETFARESDGSIVVIGNNRNAVGAHGTPVAIFTLAPSAPR